jgi:uncharacterized membrane protein YoaK (UPF0700 family)
MRRSVALRDLLLAALSFSTGVYEAAAFLTFGKVFTAFQTGNLLFLGLGAAGTRPPAGPPPATVIASLVAFGVGGLVSMAVLREGEDGPVVTSAWSSRMTVVLGIGLLAQLLFAVVWVSASSPTHRIGVLVSLGAFAMALQMNAVRTLAVPAISTTAFTATYIALAGLVVAPGASAATARRLAAVLVAIILGAFVGTLLLDHRESATPVVPLVVNAAVLVAVVAWRGREQEDTR